MYKENDNMKEYLQDSKDVLKELSTSINGISDDEALKRAMQNGKNKLKEHKRRHIKEAY